MPRWLLPENIADALPSEARAIEDLRRRLLDLYRSYGYELVMPPMLEHIESLLTGSGRDLGLRTFQLVDQLSGRTLGLRADMTPQVARIDAHLLNRNGVARLCYAGSVLHARAAGLFATREPLQVGAEIYGHAGMEADVEVIELMLSSLAAAGVDRVRLDLCHVGIVPALLAMDPAIEEAEVYEGLQKNGPSRARGGAGRGRAEGAPRAAGAGGPLRRGARAGVGDRARARRACRAVSAISAALDELERLVASPMWARFPQVELSVDLADLRGYRYHTGVTFAAYIDAIPNAVGRGGRYDDIGQAFGRARPATGFSLELRELASLAQPEQPGRAIRAPWSDDPVLARRVAELRAAGEIVVRALPGHEHEQQEYACDRELAADGQGWILRPI